MKPVLVNFAGSEPSPEPKKPSRKPWRIFFLILGAGLGVGILFAGTSFISAMGLVQAVDSQIIEKEGKSSVFKQLSNLITTPDAPLRGEEEGRTNILLLGMGGESHPGGPMLTDTIIVASILSDTKEVSMLSIPRDLVVDTGGQQYRKINNAYSLGGLDLSKKVVEDVTGLEIHYYGTVDFAGFRDVIDDLDGVEIYVDNPFVDYKYPDYNFGYQTIEFEEGWQTMDGERALQYSRSRKGNNGEGTDFKRSKRQQNVIVAIRDKILSTYTLLNPGVITRLMNTLGEHVATDAEIWEMSKFAQLAQEINSETIINQVLDHGAGGIIHSEIATETGAYVLVPNAGLGNYDDIQRLAENIFELGVYASEDATIEVQNGTVIEGFARRTSSELKSFGLNVASYKNATQKGQEVTVIYDLTDGEKPVTLDLLQDTLGANISTSFPSWLAEEFGTTTEAPPTDVDFVVVLGTSRVAEEPALDPLSATPATAETL